MDHMCLSTIALKWECPHLPIFVCLNDQVSGSNLVFPLSATELSWSFQTEESTLGLPQSLNQKERKNKPRKHKNNQKSSRCVRVQQQTQKANQRTKISSPQKPLLGCGAHHPASTATPEITVMSVRPQTIPQNHRRSSMRVMSILES